jgi:hypothetical protein
MENFATAQEATAMAMDSQGSAMIENEKYLTSIEGRLTLLKASMEGFYQEVISADLIKDFVSTVTVLVDNFGNLESVIMGAALAIGIFWGNSIGGGISKWFATMLEGITLRYTALTASINRATASQIGFNKAWAMTRAIFATNPIGFTVVAIVSLVAILKKLEVTQDELLEKVREVNAEYEKFNTTIDDLTKKYEQNFEKAKTDEKFKNDLIETELALRKAFTQTNLEIDSQNKSLQANIGVIQEATKAELALYKSKYSASTRQAYEGLSQERITLFELGEDVSWANQFIEGATVLKQLGLDTNMTYLEMQNRFRYILDNAEEFKEKTAITDEILSDVAYAYERITNQVNEATLAQERMFTVDKKIADIELSGLQINKTLTKEQQKAYNIIKDRVKLESDSEEGIAKYKRTLLNVSKALQQNDFSVYANQFVEELSKIEGIDLKGVEDELYALQKGLEADVNPALELANQLALVDDAVGLLGKAYGEMVDNEQLSLETVEKLGREYPDLIKELEIEGDTIKLNTQFIEEQFYTKKDTWIKEAQIRGERIKQLRDETIEAVKIHGIEIDSIQSIGEAYKELMGGDELKRAAEESLISQGKISRFMPSTGAFGEDLSFLTKQRDYLIEEEKKRLVSSDPRFQYIKDYQTNVQGFAELIRENENRIKTLKSIGLAQYTDEDDEDDEKSKKAKKRFDAEIDYLMEFNDNLARINALIENNKAKLEKTTDKQDQLDIEYILIGLMKERSDAISNLAWQQGQQADQYLKKLKAEGVQVRENGLIVQSSYNAVMKKKQDIINAMTGTDDKTEEQRERLEEEAETLKETVSKYREMQQERTSFWANLFSSQKEGMDLFVGVTLRHTNELMENFDEGLEQMKGKVDLAFQDQDKISAQETYIDGLADAINDLSAEYLDLKGITDENIINSEEYNNLMETMKGTIDEYIISMQEAYRNQLQIRINAVKETEKTIQDMIKKGLDDRKEALDDELEDYTDFMDDKIEQRNREFEEEDYKKDLQDQMDTRQDIQDKINALMFDNSFAAYTKRKELEEQLAEEDEKLQEIRTKRNRNLEMQALKDSKEFGEDRIRSEKEALDEKWTDEKIAVEAHNALVRGSFDLLKEEFPSVFKSMTNSFSDFINDIVAYETTFGSSIGRMKSHVKEELLPAITMATEQASRLSMLENEYKTTTGVKQRLEQYPAVRKHNEIEKAKQEIGRLQTEWNVINEFKKNAMPYDAVRLRQIEDEAGALRNKYNLNFEDLRKYSPNLIGGYANGGVVSKTGLAMLHGTPSKPEYVLNSEQFSNLVSKMGGYSNGISNVQGGEMRNNLVINIYGEASTDTVSKVRQAGQNILSELKKAMNRNGTHR